MNGIERVLAVLNHEIPDRIPTFEWVIHPNVAEKAAGTRDIIEFVSKMDIDGIAIRPDNAMVQINEKEMRDEWGIIRAIDDEYPTPLRFPVETLEDFVSLKVPDPNAPHRYDSIKKALAVFGNERCVVGRVRDVVSQPRDLMGFENYLMCFYEDEELIQRMMEMCVDFAEGICENLRDLGVKVIVVGDDIANNNSLLMSPTMYVEQIHPYFTRLVQNAKRMGLKVIKHSDGDLNAVLGELVESGIDCLDPIDVRGHMDMAAIKQKYGEKIALKGNVDCVETLVSGSEKQIRKETANCILKGGIGGGLIISSSNSIHKGINPDKYRYFLEVVKELGQYPLDIEKLQSIAAE